MNLLDIPLHELLQKLRSKHNHAGTKSELSNITMAALSDIVGDGLCHYSGKEFENLKEATFERINPEKGYVLGNVVFVKDSLNNLKGLTLDKFVKTQLLSDAVKIKLLRKALYQIEKKSKG